MNQLGTGTLFDRANSNKTPATMTSTGASVSTESTLCWRSTLIPLDTRKNAPSTKLSLSKPINANISTPQTAMPKVHTQLMCGAIPFEASSQPTPTVIVNSEITRLFWLAVMVYFVGQVFNLPGLTGRLKTCPTSLVAQLEIFRGLQTELLAFGFVGDAQRADDAEADL